MKTSPILEHKHYAQPSVFTPANLLREARRQKAIPAGKVPRICVLDPDGDLWRHLRDRGAERSPFWACYHTDLYEMAVNGETIGVLGCAVGAPFAVLVAEELFASGCEFLVSVTSAGQIVAAQQPPYIVFIDRALRDEGTSQHYLPPARYAYCPQRSLGIAKAALKRWGNARLGGSWTTDAPFRETEQAITYARSEGLYAVEMEAAALYALAEVKSYPILCIAHVTNSMAQSGNDFEKGEQSGNHAFIGLVSTLIDLWNG
ncbi:MAG: nucleoside phosphorylase [Burkholderiales bacterium]